MRNKTFWGAVNTIEVLKNSSTLKPKQRDFFNNLWLGDDTFRGFGIYKQSRQDKQTDSKGKLANQTPQLPSLDELKYLKIKLINEFKQTSFWSIRYKVMLYELIDVIEGME